MILFIDNYDSFTYNLVQLVGMLANETPLVLRNDALPPGDLAALRPRRLIVSPGPRGPSDAGVSIAAIRHFHGRIPILGVCLGLQCVAAVFGAAIVRALKPTHGRTSDVHHAGSPLFAGIPDPFPAARYHSLAVDPKSVPDDLRVTAWTEDGTPMAVEHLAAPTLGVQFHPESFLSPDGPRLMRNFLGIDER